MKKFLAVCGSSLLTVLLLAVAVCAQEVKTDYFTLDLPADWKMPGKVQKLPNGNTVAVVQSKKDGTAVSIAAMPSTAPIKDIATQTVDNMKADGFKFSEMKQVGESYVVEFSKGVANGVHYFTSNGKQASVVSIIGKTLDTGKELLQKQLKPVDPKLFPASY